jgi:chromosome segregation ATPase
MTQGRAASGADVERELAMVGETVGQMEADERRLLADVVALRAERVDLERELGDARGRLDELDAAVHAEEVGLMVTERELQAAQDAFEEQRELAGALEQEIGAHRGQIANAQRKLEGLVVDVMRIQHKLSRARADHG